MRNGKSVSCKWGLIWQYLYSELNTHNTSTVFSRFSFHPRAAAVHVAVLQKNQKKHRCLTLTFFGVVNLNIAQGGIQVFLRKLPARTTCGLNRPRWCSMKLVNFPASKSSLLIPTALSGSSRSCPGSFNWKMISSDDFLQHTRAHTQTHGRRVHWCLEDSFGVDANGLNRFLRHFFSLISLSWSLCVCEC